MVISPGWGVGVFRGVLLTERQGDMVISPGWGVGVFRGVLLT